MQSKVGNTVTRLVAGPSYAPHAEEVPFFYMHAWAYARSGSHRQSESSRPRVAILLSLIHILLERIRDTDAMSEWVISKAFSRASQNSMERLRWEGGPLKGGAKSWYIHMIFPVDADAEDAMRLRSSTSAAPPPPPLPEAAPLRRQGGAKACEPSRGRLKPLTRGHCKSKVTSCL